MPKYHLNNYFSIGTKQLGDITLTQIGVLHCGAGDVIPAHVQSNNYELTAIIDGEGVVFANQEKNEVERGCIHLVCPFELHEIRSSKDKPLKYLFFAFNHSEPIIATKLQQLQDAFKMSLSRIIKENTIISQLELAVNEVNKENELLHEQYLYSIMQQIIISTIRAFTKKQEGKVKISKKEEFCYQIMTYINANITELTSLTELSKIFNYEYSYISKLFKSTVKQTISQYYHMCRLQAAKGYLEQNYSCTEVADLLKYASIYSFSKAFKDYYNLSPTDYVKQLKSRVN